MAGIPAIVTINHPAYWIVEEEDGLTLTRRRGYALEFNVVARDLLKCSGDDFHVYLSADVSGEYERAVVALVPQKPPLTPSSRRWRTSKGRSATRLRLDL